MKRRDFCKGLAVTLAAGTLAPAAALPQAGAATALVGRAVPDDYYTLWYRSDRCGADLRHDYYYSDSLFDHPATEYDNQLALATLGMAAAADCPWESDQRYWMEGEVGRADHIRDAFAKLGFTEVQLFNYTHSLNDTPDTVGCAIARKTLVRGGRQVTIIGAFLRGSGYGAEWSGNLHAGPGSAHVGFVTAARQLVEKIRGYVQTSAKRQPLGTLKLWMGGYSRGGGVANLVAARLPAVLPQLEKKNTFVYTFAAPASLTAADCPDLQQDYDNNHAADGRLKKDWGTSNIFNIVSSGDVIPRILPAEWGFYRNGNDRFLPSTVIPEELQALNDRSAGMEGTPMDFGRLAVSEETDAVLRSMLDLFCDRQTYYKGYEDAMRCMLQCATTRTEEEVTRGIVRDDAAVVAQLRSMELMQRFPQEKVERCVQAASSLSRPVLEKLGSAVPLQAQQVQRFFVGIQPPYKDEDLRVNVQFQGAAQVGPGAGHVGDDGSVQPHGHQPGAGHAQALQLGGNGGRFGEGRCFFVNSQVAAQQQVHHSADDGAAGGAFQRAQLAVKQDAVFAAEAVERRHAGGVIAHDVDRIDLLVQQHLPAGKERLRA